MPVKWVFGFSRFSVQGRNIDHMHMWPIVSRGIACGMGVQERRNGLQQGKPQREQQYPCAIGFHASNLSKFLCSHNRKKP